ncbi:hypothetical protein D3C81_1903000 [compost metagenome]
MAGAVIQPHLHTFWLGRNLQQLTAGLLAVAVQHVQLSNQQRTQRWGVATQVVEHEGPRAHQERQAIGQPEGQK